ncbi:hypothetical protein HYH03_008033 [Edaphochlamys debaryana]|uniref:Uncharacterized protein n=1 Tax=Edaphochlamys debaryana TaxID=47281 RepID=A0A835Y225_9CHLO|nr:hypothetical protein HYH03_008033 [Edaphochlamys debaryana]|eukprot:KAG2493814.1 hypothetical protein HYH03_008033 [Edaphochlamys debaryana]
MAAQQKSKAANSTAIARRLAQAHDLRQDSPSDLTRSMSPDKEEAFAPTSLLCLGLENPVRRFAIFLCTSPYYEAFTLLLITASCTTLAMDSSRQDFQYTALGRVLQSLEYAWAAAMCWEVVMRIVAKGLILPRGAFLRSGWGLLDVLVVALGFLNLVPGADNYSAIRAFRVLRPLRAVSRVPKLKVLVITLLTALPMLLHVVILCFLVYLGFGIVGVEAFAGVLRYSCATVDMNGSYPLLMPDGVTRLTNISYQVPTWEDGVACAGPKLRDPNWPLVTPATANSSAVYSPEVYDTSHGRQCSGGMVCLEGRNPFFGFISYDHIMWAWLTIFQCITMEGWTDIMYLTQDALSYWAWPYYVAMVVFGSLFLMNLALVVLYVQFTKSEAAVRNQEMQNGVYEEELHDGSTSSGEDRDFEEEDEEEEEEEGEYEEGDYDPGGGGPHAAPRKKLSKRRSGASRASASSHSSRSLRSSLASLASFMYSSMAGKHSAWRRLRAALHTAARSNTLQVITIAAILINTVVMCINWYGIPHDLEYALSLVNAVLTFYFVCELLIKLIGIGPRRFFRDGMNTFDTLVVIASIVEVITDLLPAISGVGPLSVLRTLRFLRLLRLATRWDELRRVVQTLFRSVLSVAWMSLLTLLFLVIAALLGMQVFGYKFMFCDYVPGASPVCPLGQAVWGQCPDYFYCYLPCSSSEADTWLSVPGSQFFGHAYCQRFCADGSVSPLTDNANATAAGIACETLAAVGKADVSTSTFDNFGWSLLTTFQLVTGENWNTVMYDGMRGVGPAAALYFIFVIVVGNYVVLNLFIAILLENFAANMGESASHGAAVEHDDEEETEEGAIKRTDSFIRAELEADRLWYKHMFGPEAAASAGGVTPAAGNSQHNLTPHPQHMFEHHEHLRAAEARLNGHSGEPPRGKRMSQESEAIRNVETSAQSYFDRQLFRQETNVQRRLNQEEFMKGNSLFLFSSESKFRWRCMSLVTWKYFDWIILCIIALSSVALAIDSPSLEEEHPEITDVLRWLDLVWAGVFIFEACLKIVAFGFVFNGRNSYLRDPWNVLDFIIVLSSIAMIGIQFGVAAGNSNVQMLRALRTLRALRPLRIASTHEQLRIVILALFSSLRSLVYVGIVCVLFYLLFGILGVNLLKGELRFCQDLATGDMLDAWTLMPPGGSINSSWCKQPNLTATTSAYHAPLNLSFPAPAPLATEWVNPAFNFDHLGNSMLALFSIATTEMWVNLMAACMAAVGPEQQPEWRHNPAMSIFFVAFIVVGSFLVLNMLVAITIEKFSELQSRHLGYNLFLTPQQQAWVDVQRVLAETQPERCILPPDDKHVWRNKAFWLICRRRFQLTMYAIVFVNIIFMCLNHADQSQAWVEMRFWGDVAFTCCFAFEAAIQIYALGPRQYFTDNWYIMLFSIVVASVACIILDAVGVGSFVLAPMLRILRVTRFLKIITNVEGLHHLVRTLTLALPAILNVGSVMLLFFFIWAVLGMNLFAGVKYGNYVTRHNNFDNWPNAMMALFRQVTGESWDGTMADCMVTTDCIRVRANVTSPNTGQLLVEGSYWNPGAPEIEGLPMEALDDQCTPNGFVTVLFFISFELLCSYIILNIVVAIILEGMINEEADELLPVPRSAMLQFAQVWSELDPGATGFIRASDLPVLIMELDPPLGNRGTRSMRVGAQDIIMGTDIPNRGNRFHFVEVLHALSGRVCGAELPDMTEDKVYNRLAKRLPKEPPDEVYTAAHFHAAVHVSAAVKGFLMRYQMRDKLAEFYAALAEMEREEEEAARVAAIAALAAEEKEAADKKMLGGTRGKGMLGRAMAGMGLSMRLVVEKAMQRRTARVVPEPEPGLWPQPEPAPGAAGRGRRSSTGGTGAANGSGNGTANGNGRRSSGGAASGDGRASASPPGQAWGRDRDRDRPQSGSRHGPQSGRNTRPQSARNRPASAARTRSQGLAGQLGVNPRAPSASLGMALAQVEAALQRPGSAQAALRGVLQHKGSSVLPSPGGSRELPPSSGVSPGPGGGRGAGVGSPMARSPPLPSLLSRGSPVEGGGARPPSRAGGRDGPASPVRQPAVPAQAQSPVAVQPEPLDEPGPEEARGLVRLDSLTNDGAEPGTPAGLTAPPQALLASPVHLPPRSASGASQLQNGGSVGGGALSNRSAPPSPSRGGSLDLSLQRPQRGPPSRGTSKAGAAVVSPRPLPARGASAADVPPARATSGPADAAASSSAAASVAAVLTAAPRVAPPRPASSRPYQHASGASRPPPPPAHTTAPGGAPLPSAGSRGGWGTPLLATKTTVTPAADEADAADDFLAGALAAGPTAAAAPEPDPALVAAAVAALADAGGSGSGGGCSGAGDGAGGILKSAASLTAIQSVRDLGREADSMAVDGDFGLEQVLEQARMEEVGEAEAEGQGEGGAQGQGGGRDGEGQPGSVNGSVP